MARAYTAANITAPQGTRMELRQLRYFVKIADLGSVSKASRALHIAQPALSQQMAQLESELGHALLTRLSTGVKMTEHGELFYRHALRVLRGIDDIPAAVSSLEKTPSGTVSIGLPQSTAWQYAQPLMEATARQYPGITLELFDEISAHISARIVSGRFDMGVIVHDEEPGVLNCTALFDEQLFLLSRADVAPQLERATASDMAGLTLPLSIPGPGQGVRPMVDAFFAREGVPMPEPPVRANSVGIMRRSVMAGMAHSVMPWSTMAEELAAGTARATPIEPRLTRRVYLCVAPDAALSVAARAIHEMLLALARDQLASGQWHVTAVT